MKIKIFHHVTDMPGWADVLLDQATKIQNSGLLDAAAEYHMCCNGNINSFAQLKTNLEAQYPGKIFLHNTFPNAECWEWPTLNFMRNNVQEDTSDFYICYIHLKGLSTRDTNKVNWRLLMDYWNIERWQDCVGILDRGYDTVGVNRTAPKPEEHWPPAYSGNFWWARSSYVRTLAPLPYPIEICSENPRQRSPYHGAYYDVGNFRFDHEFWIFGNNPRWGEVYHDGGNNPENIDWYATLDPASYRGKPAIAKQWDEE